MTKSTSPLSTDDDVTLVDLVQAMADASSPPRDEQGGNDDDSKGSNGVESNHSQSGRGTLASDLSEGDTEVNFEPSVVSSNRGQSERPLQFQNLVRLE